VITAHDPTNPSGVEADLAVSRLAFVYGTLKSGHDNHEFLSASVRVGECTLVREWKMVALDGYPAVVATPGEPRPVTGEVYTVDATVLRALDRLEGHPHYYERTTIDTPWNAAWCYFLGSDYAGWPFVADGVWRSR
jgi:gamma-glutamylcyclotransferase (GGCT)/AIG2-like uncharacterized protein YtfP